MGYFKQTVKLPEEVIQPTKLFWDVEDWPLQAKQFLADRNINRGNLPCSVCYVAEIEYGNQRYTHYIGFTVDTGCIEFRRIEDNDQPKYLTIGTKAIPFYLNQYHVLEEQRVRAPMPVPLDTIIIVEDIISAIRLKQFLVHNYAVMALRGTYLYGANIRTVIQYERVILALDNDFAGKEAMLDIKKELWFHPNLETIIPQKDWKWYSDEELEGIFECF